MPHQTVVSGEELEGHVHGLVVFEQLPQGLGGVVLQAKERAEQLHPHQTQVLVVVKNLQVEFAKGGRKVNLII